MYEYLFGAAHEEEMKEMVTVRPKRKALLVGLNYANTDGELGGCENDVMEMSTLLGDKYGYEITTINDGDLNSTGIIKELSKLFEGASHGDRYVFHYSGHGTTSPDQSNDEQDGADEALCEGTRLVIDDDINKVIAKLPVGVNVLMIIDACCSGTMADLKYRLSFGELFEDESTKSIKANVLTISGCEDSGTSSEMTSANTVYGALSHEIVRLINGGNTNTYSWTLLTGIISARLNNKGFTQRPQLCASKLSLMMDRVSF